MRVTRRQSMETSWRYSSVGTVGRRCLALQSLSGRYQHVMSIVTWVGNENISRITSSVVAYFVQTFLKTLVITLSNEVSITRLCHKLLKLGPTNQVEGVSVTRTRTTRSTWAALYTHNICDTILIFKHSNK